MTDCPNNPLTIQKASRWVVFTDSLTAEDLQWTRADVILTRECPHSHRHGYARACCASGEPGTARLGSGGVAVWGRNGSKLERAVHATTDRVVFVLLVDDTPTTGGAVDRLIEWAEAEGRTLHVLRFADRVSCYLDGRRTVPAVFSPVGPPPIG